MPARRQSRKRNKSSPLVQSSPKKSKPHQADSDTDSELIQEISETECSTESESETESQSVPKTPTAATMQNPDFSQDYSQVASGLGPDSQGTPTGNMSQSSMMNPVLFSSQ